MTLSAGVSALILDGKILPVLEISETVIAVGEIPAMNSEIVRNHKTPATDNDSDDCKARPQRVQYMPFHL
jgi:hypothetical protein